VHGIRGEIHFARPCDRAVSEPNLSKPCWVGQGGEDARIRGVDQSRQIDNAGQAIEKRHAQPKVRESFDVDDPLGHAGDNSRV
jgi:hypothetical protein